jgi:hypothetical protein
MGFTNCENCLIGEMLFYQEKGFALWSKVVIYKALHQKRRQTSNTNNIHTVNKIFHILSVLTINLLSTH